MNDERNAAWSLLHAGLSRGEHRPAYLFGGSALGYGALRDASLRFAASLRARSVRPGERVLLALPDTPAFPCAFLGTLFAGACPVPVDTSLKADDYAFLLADSGARLVLAPPGRPALEAADAERPGVPCGELGPDGLDSLQPDCGPRPADPELPGFMLYSSGSTGRPKGVPHGQEDLLVPPRTWGGVLGLTHQDVVLSSSKFFFAYGLLASLVLPLATGAATVLHPGRPGPGDVFDLMARHGTTAFFGVPTLYNAMIRVFEPALRDVVPGLCVSAGEALPPLLHEQWARLTGREVLDGVGSTEAFNVFLTNRRGQSRPGSSGRLTPGFEARLVDDAGHDVPSGREGHLLLRGQGLCRAYWNRPDATRETMLPDGWLRTGDVFVEEAGLYAHRGRSDDMLKVGGQWVSPVRVEEELLRHPAVAECAVAARRVGGLDVVCAFVVPAQESGPVAAPGTGPESGPESGPGKSLALQWREFLLERLPGHMCPARFEIVPELPRTTTGKVRRFLLRQG